MSQLQHYFNFTNQSSSGAQHIGPETKTPKYLWLYFFNCRWTVICWRSKYDVDNYWLLIIYQLYSATLASQHEPFPSFPCMESMLHFGHLNKSYVLLHPLVSLLYPKTKTATAEMPNPRLQTDGWRLNDLVRFPHTGNSCGSGLRWINRVKTLHTESCSGVQILVHLKHHWGNRHRAHTVIEQNRHGWINHIMFTRSEGNLKSKRHLPRRHLRKAARVHVCPQRPRRRNCVALVQTRFSNNRHRKHFASQEKERNPILRLPSRATSEGKHRWNVP